MFFSIVIPTYNEENDIHPTIDSCLALEGDFEIVVVDDSTDNTPNIVTGYRDSRIRLIRPSKRRGRCEARNRGIHEALGEVVVILNADVQLPADFLQRISVHYDSGADYVLVEARVSNMNKLFARYVSCAETLQRYYANPELMDWTEGFSVRKDIAIAAGLFPSDFPVPIVAGEDAIFGMKLRMLEAARRYDPSVQVTHVCPDSFGEFWSVRRGRGEGIPQVGYYLEGRAIWRILARDLASALWDVLQIAVILPLVTRVWRMTNVSPRKRRDFFAFIGVWIVERTAKHVGVWSSVRQIAAVTKVEDGSQS